MSIYRSRGFTLIELLVVIAIIGVLSSVVLASLNTARTKGSDAAIKANIETVQVQAELYYDTANRYATVAVAGGDCGASISSSIFADPTILQALSSVKAANGGTVLYCNIGPSNNGANYAIATPLRGGGYYCADNTGVSRSANTAGTPYTGTTGGGTPALTDSSDYTCN